jgi:stage II sporulation protein D
VRVQVVEEGVPVVREVQLEEYVQATVISEVAPAAGEEGAVGKMLEVQAVISRTYAVSHLGRHSREGFDLCATTHCQLFEPRRLRTSRWAAASSAAVARTAGVILTFEHQSVQALFHADCGGYTSTSAAVWGGVDRPYLVARPDEVVPKETHAAWRFEVSVADLHAALNGNLADARLKAPGELDTLEIASRDAAGRAARVTIRSRAREDAGGATVTRVLRGDEFRQALSRAFGPRALRSTWFEVRRSGAMFTFEGRGFGHGVGLCQAGAFARLQAGGSPADVIRYYYPGVTMAQGSRLMARGSGLMAQARSWSAYSKLLREP